MTSGILLLSLQQGEDWGLKYWMEARGWRSGTCQAATSPREVSARSRGDTEIIDQIH